MLIAVAPIQPAGRIGVASQSGNFVSSFENYAVQTGVGISRAVSAGNAINVTVPDYLDFYADDDATVGDLEPDLLCDRHPSVLQLDGEGSPIH